MKRVQQQQQRQLQAGTSSTFQTAAATSFCALFSCLRCLPAAEKGCGMGRQQLWGGRGTSVKVQVALAVALHNDDDDDDDVEKNGNYSQNGRNDDSHCLTERPWQRRQCCTAVYIRLNRINCIRCLWGGCNFFGHNVLNPKRNCISCHISCTSPSALCSALAFFLLYCLLRAKQLFAQNMCRFLLSSFSFFSFVWATSTGKWECKMPANITANC